MSDPWQRIPADDYEAHMLAAGQSSALRDFFARVYADRKPRRLAVLGCTTGSDLQLVDPTVTETVVGVDVNAAYLDVAGEWLAAFGPRLHLVHGDVLSVELPAVELDLVHAALLLEYVDPAALFQRMHGWLRPGGICSVVTQESSSDAPAVSETGYRSLQLLAGHISLRRADEVVTLAECAGFRLVDVRGVALPGGKRLMGSVFEKALT